jgi:molecular chaperone DnaK
MRATIDYGIDLGTSNSAIAVQVGGQPVLLADAMGEVLLPSAVHVDSAGHLTVGAEAVRRRSAEPENTAVEFKRQMGTNQVTPFPASGRSLTAEQLSSEVLRALARRAEERDGFALKAAVITIPAMFQLTQCEATRRAAELAGIEHAPLLQEPIAAAIAHSGSGYAKEGHWLVYDLGGGTFDVSLVRSRAGRLQVVDHDGDNHLGGKDFNRVLARWAAEQVRAEGLLGEFRRTDPALAPAFARLASEAERVRIALSQDDVAIFEVAHLAAGASGQPVGVRLEVTRSILESLIEPIVARTIALCRSLLGRNRPPASGLKGVVLVGGPTRTPAVPRALEAELGMEARHLMDPTTIVAAGAALFASTQKLPVALRRARSSAVQLELEYESMTTNPRPLLIGKVDSDTGAVGLAIKVARSDGAFMTGPVQVSTQGTFAVPLALAAGALNVFHIEVSRAGAVVTAEPAQFSILHGMSIAKPPLSQSVGVMLADNSVRWYLRKGAVLPARSTVTHATTTALHRGESGDAIKVPLVQGESERADRNRVIGVLTIHAKSIARDLPAGAEIEVTLEVDEFSRTTARGYVPLLDRWFDEIVNLSIEDKTAEQVSTGLVAQVDRLKQLEEEAAALEAAEGGGAAADGDARSGMDHRVREVEDLLAEGDRDSVELAEQMVRLMTHELDKVESDNKSGGLAHSFQSALSFARSIMETGKERDQAESLAREFDDAMAHGDLAVAEAKREALGDLTRRVQFSTFDYWAGLFAHLYNLFNQLKIMEIAGDRFDRGLKAYQAKDIVGLYRVCVELIDLLPGKERGKIEVPLVTSNVI